MFLFVNDEPFVNPLLGNSYYVVSYKNIMD